MLKRHHSFNVIAYMCASAHAHFVEVLSLPLNMNDGVAGLLWTEQMPPDQISVQSPPDEIAAWLLHLGIPEQALCVRKLHVTGHVLISLSTSDMITSLGFQLHGDAMRVRSLAQDCLQG